MYEKSSKDILKAVTKALPNHPSVTLFVHAFFDYISAAEFDAIEEETHPELNALFDLCVQFFDSAHSDEASEIARKIATAVDMVSESCISLDPISK